MDIEQYEADPPPTAPNSSVRPRRTVPRPHRICPVAADRASWRSARKDSRDTAEESSGFLGAGWFDPIGARVYRGTRGGGIGRRPWSLTLPTPFDRRDGAPPETGMTA